MLVLRVLCCAVLVSGPLAAAEDPVVAPAQKLNWNNVGEGVDIAPLWGDARAGAYGRFVRFAPGHVVPLHVHSNGYKAVLIQGAVVEPEELKEISPGSYWFTPGGLPHETKCVSDVPCIWYEHSDAKFDITLIE